MVQSRQSGVLRASGIEVLVIAGAGAETLCARAQQQHRIAVGVGAAQPVGDASFSHTGFPVGEYIHRATKAAMLFHLSGFGRLRRA
jgi:hypothetical protein